MNRVLIAGIGNIFLGDDGFGVEVATRLSTMELPEGVDAGDYGISGMHLAYDIVRGYHTTILVDCLPRKEKPGTVTVLDVDPDHVDDTLAGARLLDAHGMQPDAVVGLVKMLGGEFGRLLVVGCEPAEVSDGIGLSPQVAAAVESTVRKVLELACDAVGTNRDAVRVSGFSGDQREG
jgi:hydrogenase maturation protease